MQKDILRQLRHYHAYKQNLKTVQKNVYKPNSTRSTNAMDPQSLKVKEQDINLTNNYCITISIPKIIPIHQCILKIQQILGTPQLEGHSHFLTTATQKSQNQLLTFLNLYQHVKNQFLQSVHFLDTVNFRLPWLDNAHLKFFDPL